MKKVEVAHDYRDNDNEPFIDRLWVNKKTGKVERIRIPIRKMRDAPVIKYHKKPKN